MSEEGQTQDWTGRWPRRENKRRAKKQALESEKSGMQLWASQVAGIVWMKQKRVMTTRLDSCKVEIEVWLDPAVRSSILPADRDSSARYNKLLRCPEDQDRHRNRHRQQQQQNRAMAVPEVLLTD